MVYVRYLLLVVVFGFAPVVEAQDESIDLEALYQQIDDAISQSPQYVAELEGRITGSRDRLLREESLEKRIQIAEELFQLYSSYRNDSALHYAELCISLADSLRRPDLVGRFRSLLAYQCSNSDMDNESLEQLRLVKRSALDSLGLVDYYHAWMHVLPSANICVWIILPSRMLTAIPC